MRQKQLKNLTIAAFLTSLGIVLPLVMPKIVVGPASFTLASHVPIFLAMFYSPMMAVVVSLGTALGFFLTLPFIIAVRALSHIVFAWYGAKILQKYPKVVKKSMHFQVFNVVIGLVHTLLEVAVVSLFYFVTAEQGATYDPAFIRTVLITLAFGGLVHSMIDNTLAYWLAQRLGRREPLPVFAKANH